STGAVSSSGVANLPSPSCKVTLPLEGSQNSLPNGNFGNSAIQTGLWANGQVVFEPGGPGSIEPDGSLGMKWWWWRGVQGRLTIEGRRLDGPGAALRSSIPEGYGEIGFQSSGLFFPTVGCWEVTGKVGNGSLTFVTQVIKANSAANVSAASF